MKIGMICRMDNSGLGTLSWEFARHLQPHKIVLVQNGIFQTFPERYEEFDRQIIPADGTIAPEIQDWLMEGSDVIFSIETFYNWDIVRRAQGKAKTVLLTMFEMTPENIEANPDLFLCPSKLDYRIMPEPKVYLPIPVAMDRLRWRKRHWANTFIHTASHGGMNGRKGTHLLFEAMKHVKSDIKLIINSWIPFAAPEDKRIEMRRVNYRNYWQCWEEGDVLVYPQDYNGICLPVIEAMASGLGVITTDIYPFNEFMPNGMLFKPLDFYRTRAGHGLMEVDAAKIDPRMIASKIDEVAGRNITDISEYGREWALNNSWAALLPLYTKTIENLL